MSGILARLSSQLITTSNKFTAIIGTQCNLPLQIREKSTKPKRRKVHPFHWWVRKNRPDSSDDLLTAENTKFLEDMAQKIYLAPGESPLRDEKWELGKWEPGTHRVGVVARKIGIYPMWQKDGKRVLTTLLQVCEQNVLSYIPPDQFAKTRFGYKARGLGALVVGAEPRDPNRFTQEYLNLFKEAGVCPRKKVVRFLISPNAALQPGTPLFANHFRAGDYVNVFGKTIDRGWLGVVKRFGMKGGNATHGCTKSHNRGGAMGGPRGRILKGKKMPGHEGCELRLQPGLKILRINYQHNVIWVKGGGSPGAVGDFVKIFDCYVEKKAHTEANPPPFPTFMPDSDAVLPNEVFDETIQKFDDPSIVFQEEVQVKRKLKVKAKVKAAGKR